MNSALQSLLATSRERPAMAEVLGFMQSAKLRGLDLSQMRVAVSRGRVIYAVLPATLPGRTGMVISGCPQDRRQYSAGKELIAQVVADGVAQDLTMIQTLVDPADRLLVDLYMECGFEQVAELIYLETPTRPMVWRLPVGLTLETYSAGNHGDFAEAIAASYQQTLDCPAMNGVRPIEDVIAGHKAAGEFDPANWHLIRGNGKPAGTLLLAKIPGGDAMELVYIGLAPEVRGRGAGAELMKLAISRGAEVGSKRLTTAVDAKNIPAMHMYFGSGMQRLGARLALVRVIHRRGPDSSTIRPQSSK